jgi:hypothetical protein
MVPVLPTWNVTSFILVSASRALNLYAIAHLGAFEVKPRDLYFVKLFTR